MYTNREGVIIILEDSDGRIAFQLRDDDPGIVGRNRWGLFGGLSEKDESPAQTAVRDKLSGLALYLDSNGKMI